jgi:putative flippase GtrA
MSVKEIVLVPHSLSNQHATDRSNLIKQVLRFGLIGGGSTTIDLLAYMSLSTGMSWYLAKGISYVLGMVFGYIGNKFWTFESAKRGVNEPLLYCVVYATTLVVNIVTNSASYETCVWLGMGAGFAKLFAFLVATGLTTVLNFLGLKYITFYQAFKPQSEGA